MNSEVGPFRTETGADCRDGEVRPQGPFGGGGGVDIMQLEFVKSSKAKLVAYKYVGGGMTNRPRQGHKYRLTHSLSSLPLSLPPSPLPLPLSLSFSLSPIPPSHHSFVPCNMLY